MISALSPFIDESLLHDMQQGIDLFSNILQATKDYSLIGCKMDGTILLWNAGAKEFYGYEPEEVIGKNVSFICTGEDQKANKMQELTEIAIREGKWEGEINRRHKNGEICSAYNVITPRFDSNKKPIGFLTISKNISKEIKISEELQASQLYTRSLIEASMEALMITDPIGRVTDANLQAETLFGKPRTELIGHPFQEFFIDQPRAEEAIKLTLKEGRVENYELFATQEGREIILSYNATLFKNSEGKLQGIIATIRDITEHKKIEDEKKKTEAALIQSELLFKQFAENSFDVLWMASATNDEIFFISSNFEKIWGLPTEATRYKRTGWLETILPEDRPEISKVLVPGTSDYTQASYLDYRIRRGDGSIRWIRDHSFEVKNEKGAVYRIGGIARDITSFKIAEIRRDLRHNIALMLVQYNTVADLLPKLIQVICESMKWRVGIFWSVDIETNTVSYFASWQKEDGLVDDFIKNHKNLHFHSEEGFVGKVLAKKEAIFVKNIVDSDYFIRKEKARQADLNDALGFPIYLRGQSYGMIEFFDSSIDGIDEDWLVFFNDIAKQIGLFLERKIAEKALIESEERFRSAFEDAAIGLALISLEGNFFQVNNSFCEILGFTKEEISNKNLKEITYKEDLIKESTYQRQILTNELQIYRTDKRFITKDKSILWASISSHLIHDFQNRPLYFIYEVQDISQRKRTEEKLVNLAYYDMLTGIPNKKLLEDTVNQTLLDASLREGKITVFFININHFKQINDLGGPELGDNILKQLALRLNERIPFKDIVGRWNGDEFVLVVGNPMSSESTALFAKKILSYIKEPFIINEKKFFITASIGIAVFPDNANQTDVLLKNAYLAIGLLHNPNLKASHYAALASHTVRELTR